MGSRKACQVHDRTLLARTCSQCGQFQQACEFRRVTIKGVLVWAADCRTCVNRRRAAAQARTQASASAHREPWTYVEEDFIRATVNEPLEDVAYVLERTIYAVTQRRHLLIDRDRPMQVADPT